jgi:hypothetical protein
MGGWVGLGRSWSLSKRTDRGERPIWRLPGLSCAARFHVVIALRESSSRALAEAFKVGDLVLRRLLTDNFTIAQLVPMLTPA